MFHLDFRWIAFNGLVLALLFLDLVLINRKNQPKGISAHLKLSAFWIGLALCFNLFIYGFYGAEKALEFFTGYIIEKSLSVDNLFVFILIFSHFKISPLDQHSILYKGILGALVFRFLFIVLGLELIEWFHWVTYLFAAFIVFTGVKFLLEKASDTAFQEGRFLKWVRRRCALKKEGARGQFIVKTDKGWAITPLFLALVAIEFADLVFALDSIPAIFSITHDPFIVYTSNVFAILGLRALYFVLAHYIDLFKYLKVGLGLILVFVGVKMFIEPFYPIPTLVSLGVIVGVLAGSFLYSPKKN